MLVLARQLPKLLDLLEKERPELKIKIDYVKSKNLPVVSTARQQKGGERGGQGGGATRRGG